VVISVTHGPKLVLRFPYARQCMVQTVYEIIFAATFILQRQL
jgi:hypothetical protein